MITTETVLILGAGSSCDYGFPTGAILRDLLISDECVSGLKTLLCEKYTDRDIEHFRVRFRDSGLNSIDSFLAKQIGANSHLVEIGKAAIAYQLCQREEPKKFKSIMSTVDWYRYLWNAMANEVRTPDEVLENKVKVITFNYDRSLEHFFYEKILATFPVSTDDAVRIVNRLPIIHVYGSLGKFADHEVDEESRVYVASTHIDQIDIALKSLKVIPEARDDSAEFVQAREWLKDAARICFLGFGFDSLNLRRLKVDQLLTRTEPGEVSVWQADVYATVRSKSEGQKLVIQERLGVEQKFWHSTDHQCLDALIHWGFLD
jgi:hypothetical protein